MNLFRKVRNSVQLNDTPSYGYFGNYDNYSAAKKVTKGYSADIILNKVKTAILKVKNGEAVYERDSVNFDEIQYAYPLLTHLLLAAISSKNELNLIDFGGSLGSSYFQNISCLKSLENISWNIVEQTNFVEEGKKFFQSEHLLFHDSLEAALKSNPKINTLLVSSSLQYLPDPYAFLDLFISYNFDYIIFDRTTFNADPNRDRITKQIVPPVIYDATYPCWFFGKNIFLDKFKTRYNLIRTWEALGGTPSIYDKDETVTATEEGLFFKNKQVDLK